MIHYPTTRKRRLRQNDWIRNLVAQTTLSPSDLIWPCFVLPGKNNKEAIASMPGVFRHSVDLLIPEIAKAKDLGIPMVAVFPVVDASKKSHKGEEAFNANNLICSALEEIKSKIDGIGLMADVALDPYTTSGQDGIVIDGMVDNDATIDVLVQQSLAQVRAGADVLGPSDMMDGRVSKIRQALESNGHIHTIIAAYSAKYASSFYGPFRDAVGSSTALKGDKKGYQQDFRNLDEAIAESKMDLQEGADMLLIKPGMPYLDVLHAVKQELKAPTLVYQVSGEYAMIHAAGQQGWLDAQKCMLESLTALKRAGADGILTYAALDVAKTL